MSEKLEKYKSWVESSGLYDDILIEGKDLLELVKEIDRLNKQIEEYQKALDETTSEKIDLENIIKEVRKYIEKEYFSKFDDFERPLRMTDKDDWNKILEILRGGNE